MQRCERQAKDIGISAVSQVIDWGRIGKGSVVETFLLKPGGILDTFPGTVTFKCASFLEINNEFVIDACAGIHMEVTFVLYDGEWYPRKPSHSDVRKILAERSNVLDEHLMEIFDDALRGQGWKLDVRYPSTAIHGVVKTDEAALERHQNPKQIGINELAIARSRAYHKKKMAELYKNNPEWREKKKKTERLRHRAKKSGKAAKR
jgi:hypothetical protein